MSDKAKHKTKIGGQALVEGVMMKGAYKGAMACRLPNGKIDVEIWDENNGKNAPIYRKIPIIRSIVNFVLSLIDGYKYTMKSAEKQMVDDDENQENQENNTENTENITSENTEPKENKKDKDDSISSSFFNILMVIACVLGVVIAVGLFVFLPKQVVGLIPVLKVNRFVQSFSEGIMKIVIFILYMWVVGLSKETRRTYEYHGAEHKTIACYEAHLDLTVENVKKQTRLHPRCGTSFIFIVLFVSILVMCFIPYKAVLPRVICSICLLPFTVGISYEIIRFAGHSDSLLSKILSFPGLQIQRITTREPDASQIECAIEALKPCIPENEEDDIWG
jgi:uncharacterized protein YqhQ